MGHAVSVIIGPLCFLYQWTVLFQLLKDHAVSVIVGPLFSFISGCVVLVISGLCCLSD